MPLLALQFDSALLQTFTVASTNFELFRQINVTKQKNHHLSLRSCRMLGEHIGWEILVALPLFAVCPTQPFASSA